MLFTMATHNIPKLTLLKYHGSIILLLVTQDLSSAKFPLQRRRFEIHLLRPWVLTSTLDMGFRDISMQVKF